MEPYVPKQYDRVFVPFGEAHERAGQRGIVTFYGPKESPEELKKLFEENPEAPQPVQFPAVTFEESDPEDGNEWIDLSRILPYTFPAYVRSYLSNAMRSVRIWPILWRLAVVGAVVLAAYYGIGRLREIRNAAPAAQVQEDAILKFGKLEVEAVQRRAALLSAQRDLKWSLGENVEAVKALDAKIAGYRAAVMRLVNPPKDDKPKK